VTNQGWCQCPQGRRAVELPIAALEAAAMSLSWDLDGDRSIGPAIAGRVGEFSAELATGRRFAGRIHPDDWRTGS